MSRKRHKKQPSKNLAAAPQKQTKETSPAAQLIAERIASVEYNLTEEDMIRALVDSDQLAGEQEFADLTMDSKKTALVSERWHKKLQKRLEAAEKGDPDEYQEALDELNIKIIDELATPVFRQTVLTRLQAMLDRLLASNDPDRSESVLRLWALLRSKRIPWGTCNLILAIYHRTMQGIVEEYQEIDNLYEAIVETIQDLGMEAEEGAEFLSSPEKFEQVEQQLSATQPDVLERAEQWADDVLDAFEEDLVEGKVELDLFSEEELLLPFHHLKEVFSEEHDNEPVTEEKQNRSYEILHQSVNEIMTHERSQRFRKQVQSIATAWEREHRKGVVALRLELALLDEEPFENNKFVISAFLGQLMRATRVSQPPQKRKKRHR